MKRTSPAVAMLLAVCVSLAAKAQDEPAPKLAWQVGPTTAAIGDKATIKVPDGYGFLGAADTKKFLELNHNLANGREYLLAPKKFTWFALFEFEPIGYVKDNETIDADEVLSDVREGTARGNEERRKRGWDTMSVVGWEFPPQYDRQAKLLEWALIGQDDRTHHRVINYNTRILGRTGVMSVVIVAQPTALNQAVAEFKGLIGGYQYVAGERYAEFRKGDKMAEYGLAALIAGGAAAVATKKGFWALLAGFFAAAWKFLAAGAVAVLAGFKRFFQKKQ